MIAETNAIRLHRVLRATPERVYSAFLDSAALVKWLPPHGFTAELGQVDARVGGGYKMSFTNFGTGRRHSFCARFTELTQYSCIKYIDKFDDPHLSEEMHVTVSFTKVSCGTELHIVQANIPKVIPLEACYLGWQESLQLLALLVEPQIPDGV